MSQQTRPSLQEHRRLSVPALIDTVARRREPAPTAVTEAAAAPPDDRSRLGIVLALVGIGLLLQGLADALARHGHESKAYAPFLFGIAIQFAACAWRLTNAHTGRRERVWVSVTLGLSLFASYAMLQPLLLDSFDELDHMGTLFRVLDTHTLFPTNEVLPVSPYYPGLELATAAARWMTGLPLVIDQLLVLSVVRVVLVLGVFLIVERISHSSRAGGVGVLVYAASPQFYGFDAQYAYETIGLAFAVGTVYLVFFTVDTPRPKIGKAFLLALASVCAVVISHHVTGWLTVGFLVIWFVGMYITTHPLRHWSVAGRWSFRGHDDERPHPELAGGVPPPSPSARAADDTFFRRRRTQTGIVGIATAVGVVVGGAWTVYVFRLLTPYLGPIFSDAVTEIRIALGNGHGDRALFTSSSGGTSPKWEILLILVAAAAWCLVLLPALYGVIFKRTVRGGGLRWIPAVIAATYPLSVVANVSSDSKLVAERATTFIFFGMAIVVGAWLAKRMARQRGRIERAGTLVLTTVIFLGSLLFGIGPLITLLPGPYQVGADSLSYGAPSFALANWASTHLPEGSNVAADKDNGVLLNAIGGVNSVTAESGLVNPELLYFDHSIDLYDIYLIRKADIRYLVVDQRLAQGRPLFGTYIADGEPPTRLTLPQLTKFNSYPFIKRIYDNGPIQVFDTTELLAPSARAAPSGPPAGGWGLDPGIFVLAAVTGALWALRLRRRWKQTHDGAHLAFCVLVGALAIGVFGGFVVRISHAPPETVAAVVLAVLLVLSVRPPGWRPRRPAPGAGESPPLLPAPNGDAPGGDGTGLEHPDATVRRNGDVPERPAPRPQPLASSVASGGAARQAVVGSTFYERREIRDVLAYLRVLADPSDNTSMRRILNVPKRGIGPKSAARLVGWARRKHVPLRAAVDRAREAGFRTQPAAGAAALSALLAELEPLVSTASPADLVEEVLERTGYRAAMAADPSPDAAMRLGNLSELVVRARVYDDLDAFFAGVAQELASPQAQPVSPPRPAEVDGAARDEPAEVDGAEPGDPAEDVDGAATPEAGVSADPAAPPVRWWTRRPVQVTLGCVGVALFAVGAAAATAAEVSNLKTPAELSISESAAGKSVAQVQLGTAGPVPARLEFTIGAHTLWSSALARTTSSQNVALPARFLYKGSRVRLVTDGHTLRWVDGWVSPVPKP